MQNRIICIFFILYELTWDLINSYFESTHKLNDLSFGYIYLKNSWFCCSHGSFLKNIHLRKLLLWLTYLFIAYYIY